MTTLKQQALASIAPEIKAQRKAVLAADTRLKRRRARNLLTATRQVNAHLQILFGPSTPSFRIKYDFDREDRLGLYSSESHQHAGWLVTDDGGTTLFVYPLASYRDGFAVFLAHHYGSTDCTSGPCGWGPAGDEITDLKSLGRELAKL